MINARLAVLAVAATVVFAGTANAATGPVRGPVALTAAHATSPAMQAVVASGAGPGEARIMVVSDAAPSMRSGWSDAPSTREPIYSSTAGKSSEAPLPGALWLFGGALLAFLGISARRRF